MNKKLSLSFALIGFILNLYAQTPAIQRDEKIEQQIQTLLKKMTLEEKIGQMCELTIDVIQKHPKAFDGVDPQKLTLSELKKTLKKYKLENEFKLSKELPSTAVLKQIEKRVMEIENAKGFQLDEAKLDSVFGKYKVGSILNVPNSKAQSIAKWQEIIKRIQ